MVFEESLPHLLLRNNSNLELRLSVEGALSDRVAPVEEA